MSPCSLLPPPDGHRHIWQDTDGTGDPHRSSVSLWTLNLTAEQAGAEENVPSCQVRPWPPRHWPACAFVLPVAPALTTLVPGAPNFIPSIFPTVTTVTKVYWYLNHTILVKILVYSVNFLTMPWLILHYLIFYFNLILFGEYKMILNLLICSPVISKVNGNCSLWVFCL